MAYLIKHYRYLNQKREAALEFARSVEAVAPELADRIVEDYVGPVPVKAPKKKKKRRARAKENRSPGASEM